MDIESFIIFAATFLALIVLFIGTLEFISIRPSEADYFRVLSFTEWKTGREIREELQKLKKGWMLPLKMYSDLARLEDRGMVERNIKEKIIGEQTIQVHSFRKCYGGRRKKIPKKRSPAVFDPDALPA